MIPKPFGIIAELHVAIPSAQNLSWSNRNISLPSPNDSVSAQNHSDSNMFSLNALISLCILLDGFPCKMFLCFATCKHAACSSFCTFVNVSCRCCHSFSQTILRTIL